MDSVGGMMPRPRMGPARCGVATMFTSFTRALRIAAAAVLVAAATPAALAQPMRQVDPDAGIDADLAPGAQPAAATAAPPVEPQSAPQADPAAPPIPASVPTPSDPNAQTYHEDDLIGAAEGVFGKGARGLADVLKDILKKQGEPNGYIVGREGGGALVVGLRYGSGTLYHKIEGQRPVYWTGPSIGFDAGANAASTFVLVYNLYDSEELYKRFVAGEGQAYFIGGFNVSYLRAGNTVLIPVRAGAGLRLGVNAGYMKFSHKQTWMPF